MERGQQPGSVQWVSSFAGVVVRILGRRNLSNRHLSIISAGQNTDAHTLWALPFLLKPTPLFPPSLSCRPAATSPTCWTRWATRQRPRLRVTPSAPPASPPSSSSQHTWTRSPRSPRCPSSRYRRRSGSTFGYLQASTEGGRAVHLVTFKQVQKKVGQYIWLPSSKYRRRSGSHRGALQYKQVPGTERNSAVSHLGALQAGAAKTRDSPACPTSRCCKKPGIHMCAL